MSSLPPLSEESQSQLGNQLMAVLRTMAETLVAGQSSDESPQFWTDAELSPPAADEAIRQQRQRDQDRFRAAEAHRDAVEQAWRERVATCATRLKGRLTGLPAAVDWDRQLPRALSAIAVSLKCCAPAGATPDQFPEVSLDQETATVWWTSELSEQGADLRSIVQEALRNSGDFRSPLLDQLVPLVVGELLAGSLPLPSFEFAESVDGLTIWRWVPPSQVQPQIIARSTNEVVDPPRGVLGLETVPLALGYYLLARLSAELKEQNPQALIRSWENYDELRQQTAGGMKHTLR